MGTDGTDGFSATVFGSCPEFCVRDRSADLPLAYVERDVWQFLAQLPGRTA